MKRLVIALVVLCALLATFLAVNGQMVLTGRLADRPLPLISGGPAVAAAARIWIDTDAACGAAPRADPDDCFAIIWLLAQGADVIGISTSFGNAAGDVVAATVTGLAAALAQPSPQVYTGYVAPADAGAGAGTDAAPAPPGVIALQAARAEGPLTILALGPLTNIAAALQERPDLQANVTRLVAVMGHRPGHLFHAAEGRGNGVAWGHGPIFRDLNVAADTNAVTAVLALGLPLTLIPFDAATGTLITADDLDRLASQSAGMAYVSRTAQS